MSSLSRFFLLFLNTFFISQLTIGQTPTVTLSLSDAFINENGGNSSLTATLSNQSGQDVVINLSLSGSATASSDFTISQASITISPGDLSGSVVLTGIDDALNEVDETIIISIQSLSNGLEDGDQQVTATVVDDEILDAAVTRVISPDSRVLITANTVEIEVSNPGTEVLANVLLTLEVDFNGAPLGSATGTFAGPLNPGSTDSFIFTAATFDFSADGLYEIRAATTLLGDENTSNDVATREVVNLVAILPPVREGFEFIGPETTFEGEDRPVINGLPGWSYEQTGGSRLRALQGFILRNHASLDNPGGDGVNTLTLNVDLSEFSLASGPRVSLYFSWFDHGEESDPEDRLSFRTHEDDPFIELYDFAANGVRGSLINVRNISINDALAANGLDFTSTFQLRFQQSDNFPINSDGISIDNVFLGVEIPGSPVSTNLTVPENVPLGSSMGSGLINDGSAIYTIANNVLAGLFEVNEVTLEVTTISSLDFESIVTDMGTNVFDFDVEVTDVVFGGSVVMPIQITVTDLNEAPVFDLPANPNQTVRENAGPQVVAGFASNMGDGDAGTQALTFNLSNDNNNLFSVQPSIDENTGDIIYTPAPNTNGSATVTVSLSDDGGTTNGGDDTSDEQTFTITVTAVNNAPSFALGGDQDVLEDAGTQTVDGFATSISPGDGTDELSQALTFNVSNDNNSLFDEQPSIDANTGGLTYTTAANANGMATVTVSLSDDGGTADGGEDTSGEQTFTITVTAVNDAPVFVLGDDQDVLEDAGAQIVDGFVTSIGPGGEADELGQALTFTISNDNNSLFNEQPSIDANTGSLTYTAVADANGVATVTVSLSDDGGTADGGEDTSGEQTFTITVAAVNDAPGFVLGDDQHILEDVGAQTVNAFATSISPGGEADELSQALTFTVSNDNNSLFDEQPSIDANTGGLTYTTAADANGMATVTVSLSDDGGTTDGGEDTSGEQTFTIMATPINDAPFLDPIADVTIDANTNELQVVNLSGISAGAANENQGIVLSASANIPNLLSNLSIDYTSPDQEGRLTFSVNKNVSAVVEVSVLINDNGGTQDGGIDENMVTFTVNIDQVITNQLFLPTLFSPNGDLTNDRFIVRGNANISMVEFSIFDRDGNEVFNSASWPQLSRDGWDGSSKGTDQPQGVYIWVVRGSFSDGSPLLINGQDTGSIRLTR